MFACPDSDKSNWKEDCLFYSPGVTVDLSLRMPGIWLALHDRGEVPRYGKGVEIRGPHVGVRPADKWSRMDPDERSSFVTYGSRVTVRWQSGKLLPLPFCGASEPKALTISCRTDRKIRTGWGRVIAAHIKRLGSICRVGHCRSTRLVAHTKPPCGPCDTFVG